jgi:hypothetical protein
MLSSRAFGLDDFARERQALTAANFAAKAFIRTFGMGRTRTHGIANLVLAQRIADADNHDVLLMRIK